MILQPIYLTGRLNSGIRRHPPRRRRSGRTSGPRTSFQVISEHVIWTIYAEGQIAADFETCIEFLTDKDAPVAVEGRCNYATGCIYASSIQLDLGEQAGKQPSGISDTALKEHNSLESSTTCARCSGPLRQVTLCVKYCPVCEG
jgi:hypothetical protein